MSQQQVMMKKQPPPRLPAVLSGILVLGCHAAVAAPDPQAPDMTRPIKVFILAGDENMLEQCPIEGRTPGIHEDFYPNATPTKDERKKHVQVAVYRGAYSPDADYDKMKPELTGEAAGRAMIELLQK